MTQSETEFGTWRDKFIEANDPIDGPLHYELISPAGERRLREFVTTRSTDDRDTDASDPPLFEFDPRAATQKQRHRYKGPDDVNLWCTLAFEIVAIRGQQVDTDEDGNYTFQVGVELSDDYEDESAIREPDGLADRVTVDSGDIDEDYQPVREFRVAGLPDQREAIKEFLRLDRGRWGLEPEHGLLLEGPPGTGKTELVMEVCREQYGSVPVEISGPEILSRWVGESERILRERFEQARDNPSRVLYIDELDAIARSRGKSTQEYSAQIVAQLLVLLDGVDTKRNERPVRVIASTNMAELVDEALRRPGRLGRTVSFGSLVDDDAIAVLHHYLERIHRNQASTRDDNERAPVGRLSDQLTEFVTRGKVDALEEQEDIDDVHRFLSHRTGAELEQLVQQATRRADEATDTEEAPVLTSAHLFGSASDGTSGELITAADDSPNSSPFADSQVLQVTPAEGEAKIRAAFEAFLRDHDEYEQGLFRRLRLDEKLFATDPDTIWSRVWEQFQPARGYPVCVYLDGYERLVKAMEHSDTASAVFEAVCERLVADPDSASPPVLFGYAKDENTQSPQLELFTC